MINIDRIFLRIFGFRSLEQVKALRIGYIYGFMTGFVLTFIIGLMI